jgi:hypothetical protein
MSENWQQILNNYFGKIKVNRVFGPSATEADFVKLKVETNYNWPAEFLELYRLHNGIGIPDADIEGGIDWMYLPIQLIPDFSKHVQQWYADTHEYLADQFFPFINYGNGDAIGYKRSCINQDSLLYIFSHEDYKHDISQPIEEFIYPVSSNLKERFDV